MKPLRIRTRFMLLVVCLAVVLAAAGLVVRNAATQSQNDRPMLRPDAAQQGRPAPVAQLPDDLELIRDVEFGKGGWQDQSSKVQAVADYFGPTDFPFWAEEAKKKGFTAEQLESQRGGGAISKLLGGKFSEKMDVAKRASPVTYIDENDPPVFIGHGENDPLVPLSQSQVFYDKLKEAGVDATLHIVKGKGHGFRDPETDKMVADFFDKHLRGGKNAK